MLTFRTRKYFASIYLLWGKMTYTLVVDNAFLIAENEHLKAEVARRAAAEAALRAEHSHLRSVLAIHEKERQLVAYDIHDGFVQPAIAASMGLQAALAACPREPETARQHVVSALQLLQRSLSQVRSLVAGLRPAVLTEAGLVAAIEQLVQDAQSSSQAFIEWSGQVAFDRLSPALEASIYRIVQEGLTNAVRHSDSKRRSRLACGRWMTQSIFGSRTGAAVSIRLGLWQVATAWREYENAHGFSAAPPELIVLPARARVSKSIYP